MLWRRDPLVLGSNPAMIIHFLQIWRNARGREKERKKGRTFCPAMNWWLLAIITICFSALHGYVCKQQTNKQKTNKQTNLNETNQLNENRYWKITEGKKICFKDPQKSWVSSCDSLDLYRVHSFFFIDFVFYFIFLLFYIREIYCYTLYLQESKIQQSSIWYLVWFFICSMVLCKCCVIPTWRLSCCKTRSWIWRYVQVSFWIWPSFSL